MEEHVSVVQTFHEESREHLRTRDGNAIIQRLRLNCKRNYNKNKRIESRKRERQSETYLIHSRAATGRKKEITGTK